MQMRWCATERQLKHLMCDVAFSTPWWYILHNSRHKISEPNIKSSFSISLMHTYVFLTALCICAAVYLYETKWTCITLALCWVSESDAFVCLQGARRGTLLTENLGGRKLPLHAMRKKYDLFLKYCRAIIYHLPCLCLLASTDGCV